MKSFQIVPEHIAPARFLCIAEQNSFSDSGVPQRRIQ